MVESGAGDGVVDGGVKDGGAGKYVVSAMRSCWGGGCQVLVDGGGVY